MNTQDILSAIDAEIARLQSARSLLSGTASTKRRGRPKAASGAPVTTVKRRTMSAAGRQRVAEAQRKRWAKQKAAAKKATKATGKPAKKAAKKATKKPAHKVTLTRVPAKKQPERRPRVPKKAPAKHALSSASETVAAAKTSSE
jgi:hypothetical protein